MVALFLLVSLISPWGIGYSESFFDSLTLGLEKQIGAESFQEISAKSEVVELPQYRMKHLRKIFGRLVDASSRKNQLEFKLSVVKDDTVNAFALPGGYVFVHTGLLSFARTDGELAGVLAHEIAHIDRRHGMQAIGRAVGLSLLLQLVLNNKDTSTQDQIRKIGGIAINLTQMGYSRENEYEADQFAVKFMTQAGFQKQDLVNFFRRLETQGGGSSPAFLQILATHPPTGERIKRIEALH
jgi:predicted Zn-dependent protease